MKNQFIKQNKDTEKTCAASFPENIRSPYNLCISLDDVYFVQYFIIKKHGLRFI